MKAYLYVFVNFETNNWAKLLLIADFAYNNAKNTIIGYMPFELNCSYYFQMSYKKDVDSYSKFKFVNKLSAKLRKLKNICCKNFHHV